MKNLILPFVVVALFAIGSCGDDAVQPDDQGENLDSVQIITISPEIAHVGDSIVITGKNFSTVKENNKVWFTPDIPGVIDSATPTRLVVRIPDKAKTGAVVVSNGKYSDTSDQRLFLYETLELKKIDLQFIHFLMKQYDENGKESELDLYTAYHYILSPGHGISLDKPKPPLNPTTTNIDSLYKYYWNPQSGQNVYTQDSLIFTFNPATREMRNIGYYVSYKVYNSYNMGDSTIGEFSILIREAPYTRVEDTLSVRLSGKELEKNIITSNYYYSHFFGKTDPDNRSAQSVKLNTLHDNSFFELKFVLK